MNGEKEREKEKEKEKEKASTQASTSPTPFLQSSAPLGEFVSGACGVSMIGAAAGGSSGILLGGSVLGAGGNMDTQHTLFPIVQLADQLQVCEFLSLFFF